MINCVSFMTAENFDSPLIKGALTLRYNVLAKKLKWTNLKEMPVSKEENIEFDQFDTPATLYLVKQDKQGRVVGTGRLAPSTIPTMLSEVFNMLVDGDPIRDPKVCEGSRVVIDSDLVTDPKERKAIADEILLGYLECSKHMGAEGMIAFMRPEVWRATFGRVGWKHEPLGKRHMLMPSTEIVEAGYLPINNEIEERVRRKTGLQDPILYFGQSQNTHEYQGNAYINKSEEIKAYPVANDIRNDSEKAQEYASNILKREI